MRGNSYVPFMLRRGDGSTLSLDFTTGVLDPRLTFTRSSTGTFINASGNVATASNNVARFDYDPTTLAPRGLLIEGSATNLCTYSEDFSNAAWTKSGTNGSMTLTGTAPDGNATSRLLEENTTSYVKHSLERSLAVSAGINTFSVWLKEPSSNSRRYAHIQLADGQATAARYTIVVDVQTGQIVANGANNGTAGAPTGTGHSITPYPGGWYRVTISMNHVASPCYPVIMLGNSASLFGGNNQPFYSATTPYKSLIVWGAQLEAGSGASSYIPTGASTVQRAAESCSMTGTNFSSWFNSTAGTFLATGERAITSDFGRLLSANANNTTSAFDLGASTAGRWLITNSTSQADITAGTVTANTAFKVAGAFASNDAQMAFNGTLGTADTSVSLPTVSQLDIGADRTAVYLNGRIRSIKFWPTRLPNATLQSLTA